MDQILIDLYARGNIGKTFTDIDISTDFLQMIPTAQETMLKLDKRDYMKLKPLFTANKAIPRIVIPKHGYNNHTFDNYTTCRQLMSGKYKELQKLNTE